MVWHTIAAGNVVNSAWVGQIGQVCCDCCRVVHGFCVGHGLQVGHSGQTQSFLFEVLNKN